MISGHSESKLKRIKNYWLQKIPKEEFNYSQFKHIIFDGTYFNKKDCFLVMMASGYQEIILCDSVDKESYQTAYPRFIKLRAQGLKPEFVTIDGHRSIIRAFIEVWPKIKIQREGMRWLRTYPKTEAGRELRKCLASICDIKNVKERNKFIKRYKRWSKKYQSFVQSLPKSIVAYKDLKKTMTLTQGF